MKRRTTRPVADLSREERQWLTGVHDPLANRFWVHGRGPEKVERCRWLMAEYRHLIPRGRRAQLEEDLAHWA
jgi:hypothetical protein